MTVANPVTSLAAREFQAGGGRFIASTVESLPAGERFNTIREDFPLPLGPVYGPNRDFALARINRLTPGGRWVVTTESVEFATTLEEVVADLNVDVTRTVAPPCPRRDTELTVGAPRQCGALHPDLHAARAITSRLPISTCLPRVTPLTGCQD